MLRHKIQQQNDPGHRIDALHLGDLRDRLLNLGADDQKKGDLSSQVTQPADWWTITAPDRMKISFHEDSTQSFAEQRYRVDDHRRDFVMHDIPRHCSLNSSPTSVSIPNQRLGFFADLAESLPVLVMRCSEEDNKVRRGTQKLRETRNGAD